MTRLFSLMVLGVMLAVPSAWAADGDAIVGTWTSQDGKARFDITQGPDGAYGGKIVWLKEPIYGAEDKEVGKPVHDRDNPDPAKRARPLIGLGLLTGFKYVGANKYKDGFIYNPDNGKEYHANLTLDGPDKLKVRGYIGVSLLGETQVWTRYKDGQK
jgi:uncharacterized protein (DUF2147 family)